MRQVRRVGLEEPAHMGMPEAAQQSKKTIALLVRRMGVFVRVAVLVVTPMHGDPFQERALDGHRAEDGQYKLDHPIGFEGPVGKQSMVADGDSHGRQRIHPQQQAAIDPMEAPAPKGNDDGHEAKKRQDDRREVQQAHARGDRLRDVCAKRQLCISY